MEWASHDRRGDFSVTELINPPQITQLSKRHDAEMSEDFSDRLWILLGQSVHQLVEKYERHGNSEVKVSSDFDIGGRTVSVYGTIDYVDTDRIFDLKVTSVYTAMHGGRDEWTQQLNMYAYLYERTFGKCPVLLENYLILRDWKARDAKENSKYPPIPFVKIQQVRWPFATQEEFIKNRIDSHMQSKDLTDSTLPPCTNDERWARPPLYAIMQEGRKTAISVNQDHKRISGMLGELKTAGKKVWIEKRSGSNPRCEGYCPVSDFCHQFKMIKEGKISVDIGT